MAGCQDALGQSPADRIGAGGGRLVTPIWTSRTEDSETSSINGLNFPVTQGQGSEFRLQEFNWLIVILPVETWLLYVTLIVSAQSFPTAPKGWIARRMLHVAAPLFRDSTQQLQCHLRFFATAIKVNKQGKNNNKTTTQRT